MNDVLVKFDQALDLAKAGEGAGANKAFISILESYGEETVRELLMTQPASAVAEMLKDGDANDPSAILAYTTHENGLKALVLALQSFHSNHKTADEEVMQFKGMEQVNQILCNDLLSLEEKRDYINYFVGCDHGKLLLLLAMSGIEHQLAYEDIPINFDVTNSAKVDDPCFIANELISLGFADFVCWAHNLFSKENAPSIEDMFYDLINIALEMAGANKSSRRTIIMDPL